MLAKKQFLKITLLFVVGGILFCNAQTLQHPVIWVTEAERSELLNKISNEDWAKSMTQQLHERVDNKMRQHEKNPETILAGIPAFGDNLNKHNAVLSLAAEAGMLYFLTKEEPYAQLSADIIAAYSKELAPRTPQKTAIMGDEFYDPRATYPLLALAYDFTYDYLKRPQTKVFNKATGKYEIYDNAQTQKAFNNIIGNILQEYGQPDKQGSVISNHPILTAAGALYTILCIEDDKERERLFDVFWEKGTKHQPSFKHTILPMFSEQGIWPESMSYSFMPDVSLILNIVDRIKPEMDVTKDNQHIFNGNFLFTNLRMPDRRFVRFGDSKRNNDGTTENYSLALDIASRRGYADIKQKAQIELKQSYEAEGGRNPKISNSQYNNSSYLQLFWGRPLPKMAVNKTDYKPTVIVKHAGIALQRNYVENNNALYGLCGIIGGAHYVHSHATGITMELYGAGYVMSPNAGLPETVAERLMPLHENYFRLYAGNNTVIVNGTSHGRQEGAWKGKAYVWQNTATNVASEPKHLEDPLSKNFSFATQSLKDEVNHCDQERTLSTIRTSETTAYYFDMFRSKSLEDNKYHDDIYHNIGDAVTLKNNKNEVLKTSPTIRYQNDIGDSVRSPGWRYFEQTEVTEATNEAVHIQFNVDFDNRSMHLFVPKGVAREYTKALAPPTREAKNGYVKKKTQVLAIRQQGEAWDRPFIGVFEPSTTVQSSVQLTEPLLDGQKIIGAKVVSKIKSTTITDYIISQDNNNAVYVNEALNLRFKGRFAIVRMAESGNKKTLSLYIGEGSKLEFNNRSIVGDDKNRGFEVFEKL